MGTTTDLNQEELSLWLNLIIRRIEFLSPRTLDLPYHVYPYIDTDDWDDPYNPEVLHGDVSDDIEFLRRMVSEDYIVSVTHIQALGRLLIAIGKRLN